VLNPVSVKAGKGQLPVASERLVTIADDAPLIQAAMLLRTGTELVVVCGSVSLLTVQSQDVVV